MYQCVNCVEGTCDKCKALVREQTAKIRLQTQPIQTRGLLSSGEYCPEYYEQSQEGYIKPKTLRDEYAMAALTGELACQVYDGSIWLEKDYTVLAERCHGIANAMVKVREM